MVLMADGAIVGETTAERFFAPMTFTFERAAPRSTTRATGESRSRAATRRRRAGARSQLGRRRDGTPRGVFCGMGVCQECVVTVDGVPSRRACMNGRRRMAVTTQGYARAPAACERSRHASPPSVERPQVLVVGAGPAGLAAARAAALCGAAVTVLDERAKPGGQYFKQRVDGSTTRRRADARRARS